jgi:hypothetical protein
MEFFEFLMDFFAAIIWAFDTKQINVERRKQ